LLIVSLSFSGGPNIGLCRPTKHTIQCLFESLHFELQSISPNPRTIIFELGYLRKSLLTPNNHTLYALRISDYEPIIRKMNDALHGLFHFPDR
jgi:hypothetical protein